MPGIRRVITGAGGSPGGLGDGRKRRAWCGGTRRWPGWPLTWCLLLEAADDLEPGRPAWRPAGQRGTLVPELRGEDLSDRVVAGPAHDLLDLAGMGVVEVVKVAPLKAPGEDEPEPIAAVAHLLDLLPRLFYRPLEIVADAWHTVACTVALEVEVANTTDSQSRIASVGLGSDWNGQPPGELPVLGTAEQAALDTEVTALRKHRYAPELRSHQYVPPQASVTGWIVSSVARPLQGGTPGLTLRVREAVGGQYLLLLGLKG